MRILSALLLVLFPATGLWAQKGAAMDFAARFMAETGGGAGARCVTVGPRMLGTMLAGDNGDRELGKFMRGVKSVRIIKADTAATELRAEAIALLEESGRRYTPYKKGNAAAFGDCLWQRKLKGMAVELVYVAPEAEESFMVLDITGRIGDDFVERLLAPDDVGNGGQETREEKDKS